MGRNIKKLMLVSRNLENYCFASWLKVILKMADDHRVDTIVFALYSFNDGGGLWKLKNRQLFNHTKHVERVLLETADLDLEKEENQRIEFWERRKSRPAIIIRQFAKGSEPLARKQAFIRQFQRRVFGNAFILNCGEVNCLVSIKKNHRLVKIADPLGFTRRLKKSKIETIINPSHTRFSRYEISAKKKHLSLGNRTVISVWNDWAQQSFRPWSVYKNGLEITDQVVEIRKPIESRPDIRIGLFTIR